MTNNDFLNLAKGLAYKAKDKSEFIDEVKKIISSNEIEGDNTLSLDFEELKKAYKADVEDKVEVEPVDKKEEINIHIDVNSHKNDEAEEVKVEAVEDKVEDKKADMELKEVKEVVEDKVEDKKEEVKEEVVEDKVEEKSFNSLKDSVNNKAKVLSKDFNKNKADEISKSFGKIHNFGVIKMKYTKKEFAKAFGSDSTGLDKAAQFGEACKQMALDGKLAKAGSLSSGSSSGGALLPIELVNDIITLRQEYGVISKEALNFPLVTDVISYPIKTGNSSVQYVGDGNAVIAGGPTFKNVEMTAKVQRNLSPVNRDVWEWSVVDIGGYIANQLAIDHAELTDQACFLGDGTATYGGIVGLNPTLVANASTSIYTTAHSTYATLTVSDFENTMALISQYTGMNPKWYMSAQMYRSVVQNVLVQLGGATMWEGKTGLNMKDPTLAGYEVVFTQVLPTPSAIAADKIVALFGDLTKTALYGERNTLEIQVNPWDGMANSQYNIYSWFRHGFKVFGVTDPIKGGPGALSALRLT